MKDVEVRWHPVADAGVLVAQARRYILAQAAAAIAAHGRFTVVLAGGSTPQPVYHALRDADTDWSAWHVYFGDERCLPAGDPERNSAMAREALLDHVPIPAAQVHVIAGEEGAYDAANAYSASLKGCGNFDLVLLGLGEDGHTASLFPGQYWGLEHDSRPALAVYKSPKPPAERVTLSAFRLGQASSVLFLVAGEGKRDAVARWRAGRSLPAAAIKPRTGVDVLVEQTLMERDE